MLWDERCLFVIFSDSTNCLKKKKEKRGEEKTERMLFRDRTPFKWSSSLSLLLQHQSYYWKKDPEEEEVEKILDSEDENKQSLDGWS